MRDRFVILLIFLTLLNRTVSAQSTRPGEVTKIFSAVEQQSTWAGWARNDHSIPGWGNKPPEPGTVTIIDTPAVESRTFSGRVDGLDSITGAEVGVVSLTYIYWNRADAYHWVSLGSDDTFTIVDNKYPTENKAVILRAPGHPWTFLSYIFKNRQGGKDIILHAEPGKAIRITVDVDGKPSRNFGVECFALNQFWIHENNPLGYQWASRTWTPENTDGNLTLYFPPHPIAVLISADGAANDWQFVNARDADHFHFKLLPAARFHLTITHNGKPEPNTAVLIGNENAPLSLRGGATDIAGKWNASSMPPGRWWMTVGKNTVEFDLAVGETIDATYAIERNALVINR